MQEAWDTNRAYLLAIATGMLRQRADGEDVVQEAFARLAAAGLDSVEDVRGWLVVVTRRLCLDRLGAADTRRTTTIPAPPEGHEGSIDPADRLTLDDEVRQALAVVIDRLSPAERTSFILHDVFGFPFDAIAQLVGRTPAGCRQLARRARMSIRSGSLDTDASIEGPRLSSGADLAERFIAVCEGGDIRQLVSLLDPDVAGLATVIGWPPLPAVQGVEAVAQRILDFFGPGAGVIMEPFAVEGRLGIVARRGRQVIAVLRLDEREGRIHHVRAIAWPRP
jgi:RNA polymerase sigma-70 factor, ECF subfamily